MAFTASDITAIETAIVDIATRGAVEVEINGRRAKYSDPLKLYKLLEIVKAEVNGELYGGAIPVEFTKVAD